MPLLALIDAAKDGGDGHDGLDGVDVDVSLYEFVVVVGPGGTADTLLRARGGWVRVQRGRCVIDGHDVAHLSRGAVARLRAPVVGFVFHDEHLLPRTSVVDNVQRAAVARALCAALDARALRRAAVAA